MSNSITYMIYNKINKGLFDESIILLNQNKNKISFQEYYSLLIRSLIGSKNYNEVEKILLKFNIKLMKRDYISYIIEIYNINKLKSIELFNFTVNNYNLDKKDIDLLISNNMKELLKILENAYLLTSFKSNVEKGNIKFKLINFNQSELNNICNKLKKHMNSKFLKKLILKIKNSKFNYILDGGNILFSNKGKNNFKSYKYLISLLEKVKDSNPLLIIHQKYLKINNKKNVNNQIEYLIKNFSNNIFKTPYKNNDDYYIIFSSLLLNVPIISNDNFKDHIFTINNIIFKNYLNRYLLKYNNLDIECLKTYSKCIQIINDNIYIPSEDGYFYKCN